MIQGIKVIDFHAHFPCSGNQFPGYEPPPRRQRRRKAKQERDEQSELWRKAYNFPARAEETGDDRQVADRWHSDIVAKGIEMVAFVTGGGNQRLADIIACHPDRFVGFAHHHPAGEDAPEQLEQAVTEMGLRGYKILAPAVGKPLSDESFYPLWEICAEHEIPVLIHFGILGAAGGIATAVNINPLAIHAAAKDFPEVDFVIPHFGAGYPTELLHLCWVCPNVHVDTSGSNQWVRWMACNLSLQDLFRKFYETIGPDRILFATDSSWFPRAFCFSYLEEQHRIMRLLRFKEEDIVKILYGNAARLLKIDPA